MRGHRIQLNLAHKMRVCGRSEMSDISQREQHTIGLSAYHIPAVLQQELGNLRVALLGRNVQGCRSVPLGRVHLCVGVSVRRTVLCKCGCHVSRLWRMADSGELESPGESQGAGGDRLTRERADAPPW